jgi:putative transposase
MPNIPREHVAGHAYHVPNRGIGGTTVFLKDGDYTAFLDLLATAKSKLPVKLFGVCLIPNHFHLIVQPATEAALSRSCTATFTLSGVITVTVLIASCFLQPTH